MAVTDESVLKHLEEIRKRSRNLIEKVKEGFWFYDERGHAGDVMLSDVVVKDWTIEERVINLRYSEAVLPGSLVCEAKVSGMTDERFKELFEEGEELDQSDYANRRAQVFGMLDVYADSEDEFETLSGVHLGVRFERRELYGDVTPVSKKGKPQRSDAKQG